MLWPWPTARGNDRPVRRQLEAFRDWWYGTFLLTALHSGYRTSSPVRRLLVLGTASATAAAVSVLCVAVNDAGSWQVRDPRGWLPALFIPEIVLVALTFGIIWGLGAALVASVLTVLGASADGGALFGTANTVNLLGFAVLPMFVAAGWCYGTDRVRRRPRWQLIVSVPAHGVTVVRAGKATEELAERLAELLPQYQNAKPREETATASRWGGAHDDHD